MQVKIQVGCLTGLLFCSGGDAMSMERFLNKVIHGDCLEVMKDIPEKSVDMILCDLPYG
jgi:hypothetical protein